MDGPVLPRISLARALETSSEVVVGPHCVMFAVELGNQRKEVLVLGKFQALVVAGRMMFGCRRVKQDIRINTNRAVENRCIGINIKSR